MNLKRFPKRLDSKTSSLRITVPENLDLALEGLIRKVLREQPKTDDIYSFAANYFETLLKIRDKAGPNYALDQSCPFHNDEDAHEMFKLAGTFKKPEKYKYSNEELTKKVLKRSKPKRTVKDEKIVKEKPVNLVKKSMENRVEKGKTSLSGRKTETIEEKVEIEGEFLTSDPIKELVEKELMMEGKGSRKQAAAENCKKDNKPEELKVDDKPDIKDIISEEKPTERNTETVEIKDVSVHPEVTNKADDEVEAVKITNQHPTEQAQPKQTEESEPKEVATKNAETPKREEVQIDEETKATGENIEFSVENDSSIINPPNNRKNEDNITIKNEKGEEILSKIETVDEDASQDDGKTEHKETLAESESTNKEEKPLKSAENNKVKLGIGDRDVENKTNEQEKEFEGDEQTQKAESPKLDDAKPIENAEPKGETPEAALTETTSKQDDSNETASDMDGPNTSINEQKLKEEPKPVENQTEEPIIDSQEEERKDDAKTQKQEGKKIEVDVEHGVVEKAENEREEEITNQEELSTVVDVKNVPKEDTKDEKQIEKSESENKDEKTIQASTVIDVKSIPKEDTRDEKEIKKDESEHKNEKTTQEKASPVIDAESTPKDYKIDEKEMKVDEKTTQESTVVDVKSMSKDIMEEKQIGKTENKIQEEKETNPGVLEDVKSITDVKKEETTPDELCTVVDVKNIPKEPSEPEKTEKEELEELPTVEDVKSIPKEETIETDAIIQDLEGKTIPDELCRVVDILNIPKEDKIEEKPKMHDDTTQTIKDTDVKTENEIKTKAVEIELPDIIEPENPDAFQPSEEIHIKTIQTHYYDTLQVPETVTKEYIVHNVATPQIHALGIAESLQPNHKQAIDENMNAPPPIEFIENINDLSQNMESNPQISDSDDLLDITTPTSGYSLNLSEISWQTVNGIFLESERKYSALELEEIRYSTQSEGQIRHEVEEIIHKKLIPTGVTAVPVPPRDMEEINSEQSSSENVKEKKKPEGESEGSRSDDSDLPFISVEVKTVIETQVLDEEEKHDEIQHPGVEVTVETTIDIQDDVGLPQSEPDSIEEENKLSSGKSQDIDLKPSLEQHQSTSQDQPKESTSTEQGTSVESISTISSTATEIKRSYLGKRNFSSTRSLLSTQSLDLGKKNPLLKTRSLSTFRHGVTDFEVWNTIEKELEEAATKIQSKFRGYKTRKKLQRENAVQITTEESSPSPTPAEIEIKEEEKGQQSTGEFHDSIILSEHPR